MKGIVCINGIGVEEKEMKELREVICKINRKRKAEGREKIDYICMIGQKMHISADMAKGYKKEA